LTTLNTAARATLVALSVVICSEVRAEAWFDAGDSAFRHDLEYLVDSGVIDIPLTAWPIPSADVAQALESAGDSQELSVGQRAALDGVKRRLGMFERDATRITAHASAAGSPIVLRTFEDTPREEGEIGGSLSGANAKFSGRLSFAWVANPSDDLELRLDGTYGSMRLGNWLLTLGELDRWWGPGWDGSVLLSSNARPLPAVSIDRESSAPFKTKWLSWLGSWRYSMFMGRMEDERQDRDHPWVLGTRFTFRPFANVKIGSVHPFRGLEFAAERTAQWCAEGLPCDLNAFWHVLAGKDSAGVVVSVQDEPGNQLGGYTVRWASPAKWLPVALYYQKTGESGDLNGFHIRLGRALNVLGAESWGAMQSGLTWRAHVEAAYTTCGDRSGGSSVVFDCAYTNHLFQVEGYRYRGRPLGDSIDGDGRSYTFGLQLITPHAWSASLLLRSAELNRGGVVPDPINTVAPEPVDLQNVEISLEVPMVSGDLMLGAGYDRTSDKVTDVKDSKARGYLEYRHRF
jgi:hypothetical protein